jgi:hypothetical protein
MTPQAARNGRVRSATKASATAHQENDGARRSSGTQAATRSRLQAAARRDLRRTATTVSP